MALYDGADVSLDGITVKEGSSTGGVDGGCVAMTGSSLKAHDTIFTDCTSDGEYAYGGAIWASSGSNIRISGTSEVSNCLAQDYGGGIYLVYSSTLKVSSGTTFSNNEAGEYGGAVYAIYDSSVDIEGAYFLNNKVGWYEWDGEGGEDGAAVCSWSDSDIKVTTRPLRRPTTAPPPRTAPPLHRSTAPPPHCPTAPPPRRLTAPPPRRPAAPPPHTGEQVRVQFEHRQEERRRCVPGARLHHDAPGQLIRGQHGGRGGRQRVLAQVHPW